MIYSREVEEMCPVAQGVHHGAAPIPEEAKWVQAKAAQLCFGIVKNHPMIDGNKRLGTDVMLVFMALNGYELLYTQQELSNTILDLAAGKIGFETILQWIISHQK